MAKEKLRLPTKPTEAGGSLDDYAFYIHGEFKIGKTTLANVGNRVLFLQCDPPQRAYRRYEVALTDWGTNLRILKELTRSGKKDSFPYSRVVVDGADLWYDLCFDYMCEVLAIKHPEDLGWGKGWAAIRKEFTGAVLQLLSLPCSRWFISHSTWRETTDMQDKKVDRFVPRLSGQAEDILLGRVDGVFCYDYDNKGRILRLQEGGGCFAGHRLDSEENPHFRHARTGKPLQKIRVEGSPKYAYRQLVAAFENRYPMGGSKK